MEEMKKNEPQQPAPFPPLAQIVVFPTGSKELRFGAGVLILSVLLCNSLLFQGLNLGFAVMATGLMLCSALYLLSRGKRLGGYTAGLLGLGAVIALSFMRSDDAFVKFVMMCFLLIGVNLALCLLAGQNLRLPRSVSSLLDAPRAVFMMGLGGLDGAWNGLKAAIQQLGTAGKRRGAVLVGLAVAVPILAIVIPLLTSADAAFDGMLEKLSEMLPELDGAEIFGSLFFGVMLSCLVYTQGVALVHKKKPDHVAKVSKGVNAVTLNTVLIAVCVVYLAYLLSQLAYFTGGFAGILPEGYTMAEYARRGFFEMAWLCAINLGLMTFAVGLVEKKEGRAPLLTRILCLAIGIVTLFFVATASAKMLLYIGGYGLTRLRVLTEVIMVFLGITTVVVSVWLFVPKLQYMKVVLLTALVMGAAVAWVDVDTVVAAYNVDAYLSGKLESVDMAHLRELGYGAIPHIEKLAEDEDKKVRTAARGILENTARELKQDDDIRNWSIARQLAWEACKDYLPEK